MPNHTIEPPADQQVQIPVQGRALGGVLNVPPGAKGIVLFAHGSGSSRLSPRNRFVARELQEAGLGTLLLDLLDEAEADDQERVFDVAFLAERILAGVAWLRDEVSLKSLPLGLFGASTGAGAALVAAARKPGWIGAVVSRGGRPDLAGDFLGAVRAPTLLIVGGDDRVVVGLNRRALQRMTGPAELVVIPGATHLFSEPGALEGVARRASRWFVHYLADGDESPDGEEAADADPSWFWDRADAGRRLARLLKDRELHDPLVLAIPRGGVVTGAVLAEQLGAELDVVLSRKLRAPAQQELALGAVSEDGQVYLDRQITRTLELPDDYLRSECRRQLQEIQRRKALFRAVRPRASIAGRSVIVTDDGIATGATMIAALQSVRAEHPRELIAAAPVASPERLAEVRDWCDDAVCLWTSDDFAAVGQFYLDFTQVKDEEALDLLRCAGARRHRHEA